MNIIKTLDIETDDARFELTISANPGGKGFTAEYYGTTPKFAQVVRPGSPTPMMKEIGPGRLVGEDLQQLIEASRAQIEKLAGKIQQTSERETR